MGYARTIARHPEEARDAVQEAFLRYCMERRYGREIENPGAWLFQVARNHLLNVWNSASGTREVTYEALDALAGNRADPEALAGREQRARAIREQLTPRELECLRLRAEG